MLFLTSCITALKLLLTFLVTSLTLLQIFPDTVYPGAESPDPAVEQGAQFGQLSPPTYPSPWGEGLGDWGPAYEKARALVSQMTLLEKVNVTTGSKWSQRQSQRSR